MDKIRMKISKHTLVFFQRQLNHVNHIDVRVLDDQLHDIGHRIFEIEKHGQENICKMKKISINYFSLLIK
jgi:hypothetical protein